MGKWDVRANGDPDSEVIVTVKSYPDDGFVSLYMPSPDPVVMTPRKLEEIRLAEGAAIADAQAARHSEGSHVDV